MNKIQTLKVVIEALTECGYLLDVDDFRKELGAIALGNVPRTEDEKQEALETIARLFTCDFEGGAKDLKPHMGFFEKDLIGKIEQRGLIADCDEFEAITRIQKLCDDLYAFSLTNGLLSEAKGGA